MTLDAGDPYQYHAFHALGFLCDDCGIALSAPKGEVASDAWCKEFARLAREAQYYVPPAENEQAIDWFTGYCGVCAGKRGLR